MEKYIDCGNIVHKGQVFKIYWEGKTHGDVMVTQLDEDGKEGARLNYGQTTANSELTAVEAAKKMLEYRGV
jgi:hypothetical protein